jgi:hypothetical protein
MHVRSGQEYKYKLSIAMAELFLEADVDALLYPSIQMRANADNLAILPRYADKHLKFRRATFGVVDGIIDGGYVYRIVDTAESVGSDGRFAWTGTVPSWARQPPVARLAYEDGRWMRYDKDGGVIVDA